MDEIRFRTARFNTTVVHPHFINDRCFGEDCAAWLEKTLSTVPNSACGEAWQEDWGWQFDAVVSGRKARVGVGLAADMEEWLVIVEAATENLRSVVDAVSRVLAAESDFELLPAPQ